MDYSKAVNECIARNYDRLSVLLPKGQKAVLKQHAQSMGMSVNALINRLVRQELSRKAD